MGHMVTRLGRRTAFVVAVLVLFCYGIVGIPHGGLRNQFQNGSISDST